MDKSPEAFRTISEVAETLETPAHVLRFWESRFPQIRPVKRAGGRRYYRPADVALLTGIKWLLHDEGLTIRGVQKILREQGVRHVAGLTGATDADLTPFDAELALETALAQPVRPADAAPPGAADSGQIIALRRPILPKPRKPAPDPQPELLLALPEEPVDDILTAADAASEFDLDPANDLSADAWLLDDPADLRPPPPPESRPAPGMDRAAVLRHIRAINAPLSPAQKAAIGPLRDRLLGLRAQLASRVSPPGP